MNYIINPSWFYWLGVVNSMRGFMLVALVDGFNQSQIAEKLGCSRQNVAQQLDRIRCEFAEFYNSPEWYTGKLKTKHERKT